MLKRLRSDFIGNVTTMLTGNIAAQVVGFLCAPVLSRIYSPEAFGSMTLIWSIVGTFSIVATLRYEQAIVIEKEENEAVNVFFLCLLLSITASVLSLFAILFWGHRLANLLKLDQGQLLLWFIPLGLLVTGIVQAHTFFYTRHKRFTALASLRALQTLISQLTKITFGLSIGAYAGWLIFGNILGPAFSMVIMIIGVKKCYRGNDLWKKITWERLKKGLLKYKQFPMYHVPTGFLNQFSIRIIIFVFATFYGPVVVGLYGFMNNIARQPLNLFSQSLTKVFLQDLSEAKNKGFPLKGRFLKTTGALALIGLVPFLVLGLYGDLIFSCFFGKNWTIAGVYAQCMAPFFYMLFINPPATQLLVVLQKIRFLFIFNLFNSVSRIGLILLLCLLDYNPKVVLVSVSALGVFFNFFYIGMAYKNA